MRSFFKAYELGFWHSQYDLGSTSALEIYEAEHTNKEAPYRNMVNNSIRPEMIVNKWAGGIISMIHNAVILVVALDVEMEKKGTLC